MYNRVCQTFVKKTRRAYFFETKHFMKNGNKKQGDFMSRKKRNMFGGVYILVYNVYITSEAEKIIR